jgi:hypothetical protein
MTTVEHSKSYLSSPLKLLIATWIGVCTTATSDVSAQSLHAPSRTLFKCQVDGKTLYSDSPCLGAEKMEVEPTRGVNKLSGTERIGRDVRAELEREAIARAIRPITGISDQQFKVEVHRHYLSGGAQQECRRLDQDLANIEYEEKRAAQPALRTVQERLYLMRQRFRELRC